MSPTATDREIFAAMVMHDTWDDADLYTVFSYLWKHRGTQIPESWYETMSSFEAELREAVTGPQHLVDEYNAAVASQS